MPVVPININEERTIEERQTLLRELGIRGTIVDAQCIRSDRIVFKGELRLAAQGLRTAKRPRWLC